MLRLLWLLNSLAQSPRLPLRRRSSRRLLHSFLLPSGLMRHNCPALLQLLLHVHRPRLRPLMLLPRLPPGHPTHDRRLPRLAATSSRRRGSSYKLYMLHLHPRVDFPRCRWPLGITPGSLASRPSALRAVRPPKRRQPRSGAVVGALRRRRRRQASRQASGRRVDGVLVKLEAGVARGEAHARCCGSSCRGVLHAARPATAARGAPRQGRTGP